MPLRSGSMLLHRPTSQACDAALPVSRARWAETTGRATCAGRYVSELEPVKALSARG